MSSAATDNSLKTLDPRAMGVWRISWAAAGAVGLALYLGLLVVLQQTDLLTNLAALGLLAVCGIAAAVAVVWFAPIVEWRHWRYLIDAEELDLRSGIVVQTRTLIPTSRVQHVDFRQGPLEQRFGLATIVIHTAAGSRDIPGIAAEEADPLRSRIAALANLHDDL